MFVHGGVQIGISSSSSSSSILINILMVILTTPRFTIIYVCHATLHP